MQKPHLKKNDIKAPVNTRFTPRVKSYQGDSLPFLQEFDDRKDNPGFSIAGVDEAGRGPLAGPVVAAAVVLKTEVLLDELPGLADSKTLTADHRSRLFDLIYQSSQSIGVGIVSEDYIDRVNILRATLLAMKQAIDQLSVQPDLILVDGLQIPDTSIESRAIVKGDQSFASIAAASIIAKVTRDRIMKEAHREFPCYRFDLHKGYGTEFHLAALEIFGPCELHRRTFEPVAQNVTQSPPSPLFERVYPILTSTKNTIELELVENQITNADGNATLREIFLLKKLLEWKG